MHDGVGRLRGAAAANRPGILGGFAMSYCTRCGQPGQPGMQFCTSCGAQLSPAQPQVPAPAQPQVQVPAPAPAPVPPTRVEPAAPPPPPAPVPPQRRQPDRPLPPLRVRPVQRDEFPAPPRRTELPGRPPRPPGPSPGPRRDGGPPLWAIVTGAILIVAICAAVVTIVVIDSSPAGHVNLSGDTGSASARQQRGADGLGQPSGTSASLSAPQTTQPAQPPSEQAAAQNLAALLAKSVSDRSAITSAVTDVNRCGANLSGDASVFRQAASSRQQLLGQLAQLPGRAALPVKLIQDLTGAWQASQQADKDFAAWAGDENTSGCTPDDSANANYQAATGPDNQATADKHAFVSEWNPIASRYGLPAYQWNKI